MNHKAVLRHLREAKEELDRTVERLSADPAYDEDSFQVAMSHLYHHLNTAWNGRAASREQHRDCSQQDFDAWRRFPSEAELLLD